MMEFCVLLLLFVFSLVVSFCFLIKETRKWGAARRNSNTKWEEMVQNPKHHIVQPGTGLSQPGLSLAVLEIGKEGESLGSMNSRKVTQSSSFKSN